MEAGLVAEIAPFAPGMWFLMTDEVGRFQTALELPPR
jgi:hypothetical protein